MSEENKKIFCTQCGSENTQEAKFCSNCGAKLEKVPTELKVEGSNVYNTEVSSDELFKTEEKPDAAPVYERAEGEVVNEGIYSEQPEIQIQYEAEEEPEKDALEQGQNGEVQTAQTSTAGADVQSTKPQYYAAPKKEGNGNIGFSIASMVCGILSLICCCFSFFGLILSIAAIVLGIISLNGKYDGKGMAIAGLVTGGIGALIFVFTMIIGGVTGLFGDMIDEFVNY